MFMGNSVELMQLTPRMLCLYPSSCNQGALFMAFNRVPRSGCWSCSQGHLQAWADFSSIPIAYDSLVTAFTIISLQ